MTRLLVLRHNPEIPPGLLGETIDRAGLEVDTVDPITDEAVPTSAGGWDGLIALGGFMAAYDEDTFPGLADEKELLASAVGTGVPVLGICLGCQLLAEALGGRAYRAPAVEAGLFSVELTTAGRDDRVLRHLDRSVPVWHGDTWDLPDGALLLARSKRYPQAFRMGSGLGIQPHPEATPEIIEGWMAERGTEALIGAGVDPEDFLMALRAHLPVQRDMAARLFSAWVEEVAAAPTP